MVLARGVLVAVAAMGCMSAGGCLAPSGIGEERVVFTGTVERVELLGQREATVYPIGVDPQFLLVVKVNSVKQNKSSPIASGQSISFAIHSPSRLFGTENPTGREFQFKATWVSAEPDKRFSWIEARPEATGG